MTGWRSILTRCYWGTTRRPFSRSETCLRRLCFVSLDTCAVHDCRSNCALIYPFAETRRDFAALQTLLASLALSPSLLENAEYVDQRWGYERFLVEDHESALPELGSALDVFQAR